MMWKFFVPDTKKVPRALTLGTFEIPFLADAFELAPLGLMEYGIAFGLAVLIIPIVEIVKLIQRLISKEY